MGEEKACCFGPLTHKNRCVSGPPEHDNCYTEAIAGGYETRIECGDASDCGSSESCCAYRVTLGVSAGYYARTACATSCGAPDTPLCNPAEGDKACTRPGAGLGAEMVCGATSLLPTGYSICAPAP